MRYGGDGNLVKTTYDTLIERRPFANPKTVSACVGFVFNLEPRHL